MSNYKEERPWGTFENLLDAEYCKVKELVIKESIYKVGEVVTVPVGVPHRIENKQDEELRFIEVQTGTYFGEDDIVRLKDDYNREKSDA